jgi:hypothetical protein
MMSSALDGPMRISDSGLEFLEQVQGVVDNAVEERNESTAFQFARNLRHSVQVSAWGLAMLLYEMKKEWGEGKAFESTEDFNHVAGQMIGLAPDTVRRYIKTWDSVIEKPKYLVKGEPTVKPHSKRRREKLLGHALPSMYLLSSAAAEGQMSEEHWKEAEQAPNQRAIRDIRNNIRGTEHLDRSDQLLIMLDTDGSIKARMGKDTYETIGFLNLELDSVAATTAIERIINRSGMFKR